MAITVTGRFTQTGKSTVLPMLSTGGGSMGVFVGGYSAAGNVNTMEYIIISSPGNAESFGTLSTERRGSIATSNGVNDRGVFGGGFTDSYINVIEYITITSPGDAAEFGILTMSRAFGAGVSNGSNEKGVFCFGHVSPTAQSNVMDYVTISSMGNATLFGNRGANASYVYGCSNGVNDRGVFGIGMHANTFGSLFIEYITISSGSNAVSFGVFIVRQDRMGSVSNDTNERGLFVGGQVGGNIISYITISNTGNATDFGDLTVARSYPASVSSGTGEHGVFGGGTSTQSAYLDILDHVTISSAGHAVDFGDLIVERTIITPMDNGAS